MLSRQDLIQRLSSPAVIVNPRLAFQPPLVGNTPASVLIPILNASLDPEQPVWHLLFTRRTDHVADHKGQVSFPGGRADPQDVDPESTALREAYEEIGLLPEDVQVMGKLDQLPTVTNYLITPVVGLIPWPYSFNPQAQEVSRVFTIPLDWLADPTNHTIRRIDRIPIDGRISTFRDVIYFDQYDGETLWGVSAEITVRLINQLALH